MVHKAVALGDKVEVSRLRFNPNRNHNNEKVYVSIVQDINEDEIIISAPIENGRIIPLDVGKSYTLSVYTKGGLYTCESSVKNRYKKNQLHFIVMEVTSIMEKSQRRQYFRLGCILSILFADINENEDVWNEGLIVDISGGGLRFTSKSKIDSNSMLKCKIELSVNNKVYDMELKGKVILSDIVDFDTMKYETRIMFDDISDEDREKIIKFIFEEERKRRKQKKGL